MPFQFNDKHHYPFVINLVNNSVMDRDAALIHDICTTY